MSQICKKVEKTLDKYCNT